MVAGVRAAARRRPYDAVALGVPAPVARGRLLAEPVNLGAGWMDFDYEGAFRCPVRLVNDAAMQALGSYRGGRMLFLGLGTGLGSALVSDGRIEPMELARLPYRRSTLEDYAGQKGLERMGKKKWRRHIERVVELLAAAFLPDDIVIGGGNVTKLKRLPAGARAGSNDYARRGGLRLWDRAGGPGSGTRRYPR
jgi:predicted NBD/HSP70 family sugar kinase